MTITSPLLGPQNPEEQEVFAQEAEKFDREIESAALDALLRDKIARIITIDHLQLLHDFEVDCDTYRMDPESAEGAYATADAIITALRKQIAEAEARGMQVKPLVSPDAAPSDEYTRGRIAGLEEAEKAVRARVMEYGNRDDAEAKRCADAIRALIRDAT